MPRGVPRTGCLCPELATTLGALVLTPEVTNLCPVVGAKARGAPGVGSLCAEVATTLGELVLSPARDALTDNVGVLV